ncbi:MAG: ribonuclease H-like domain-containing protein [Treponema sp.]|jgi:uncharacterized protein YprB with RNaseH-like and TPR domain|nr:ribonuclease H-like domain-containing protein [Treponema sp.]
MSNLQDRLRKIQKQQDGLIESKLKNKPKKMIHYSIPENLADKGWESCGFLSLKRDIYMASPLEKKTVLPKLLPVIVSDLAGRALPKIKDFLFFDLETTGLSRGHGTVAFLAAFGRFVPEDKLKITQYLLLDYSGENDFLEAVLGEFKNKKSVIVTYNGKCFDSPILKTRCLVNRIKPPEYLHADLLYPARRLWKKIISSCSQVSVETNILGIDRDDDIPGALAPEIWFEFLKTGRTDRLLGICDHNTADISGLAKMLSAMISIAQDPVYTEYRYDRSQITTEIMNKS